MSSSDSVTTTADGHPKRPRTSTAAGTIHTDIADNFIKAEVIDWSELVELGTYSAARDRGLLRIEGRDYVVRDGDVITIKV